MTNVPGHFAVLPDGRTVEAIAMEWADPLPDDPEGGLPVNVTVEVEGEGVRTIRVWLTDEEMRKAFGSGVA